MTPEFLESAGKLLFGDRWQTDTAELLGVTYRTVRRWISGESAIPSGIKKDLLAALENRQQMIAELIKHETNKKELSMYLVDYKIVHKNDNGTVLILKNIRTKSKDCYRIVRKIDNSFRNMTDTRTANACDEGAEHVARALPKNIAICQAIEAEIGIGGMIDVLDDHNMIPKYNDKKTEQYKNAGLWFDIE
ncbi:helix-turn-helix domain-containing protein [Erwinia endophytica]|uniref:helix-turn-helix domain-containing protein n=1 Tax=Erwinia endophytica TaxID=1563158 RepID=UPI00186B8B39|nr:hypothetical protein [Erwinia endophytica]